MNSADKRDRIAVLVEQGLRRYMSDDNLVIRHKTTTSGCPIVEVSADGDVYHLTITRARKP